VGVPYEDTGFGKIENFMNLKSKIDWTYAKAMLANMNGNHFLGGRYAPSTRILKELGKAESRDYFSKKANLIGEKGLAEGKVWRESCFKLYDSLWDESEKIRASKSDQSQKFFSFFRDFYNKNSAELFRCQGLVRPANILENTRRFWFFSFIQAFTLLEKNNVTYSCREKTWLVHSKIEFGRCRANTFEKSFEQAVNGLRLMKTQMNQQYHFVEYDSLTGGSHQALYAWIYEGQRNYGCKNGTAAVDISNTDIFPQDVVWESFEQGDARVVR
ncbi:MAG: hypothetical protein K2Q18_03765, partial [Bdellovibrionales bacterium]|nr:hypothetical protein [Bdellovibrionales bacterium]